MRRLFAIERDLTGNLPVLPDVFPGVVVRLADDKKPIDRDAVISG